MKLLLDTHAFLWWDSAPERLSSTALALCQDTSNVLFVSVVSFWEIHIKRHLGKIQLSRTLEEIVEEQTRSNDIQMLSVQIEHVLGLDALPDYHKDPFDRLLISQARLEGAVLISNDQIISKYPVSVRW